MHKINFYLEGIQRADWFSESEQQALVEEACDMQKKGRSENFPRNRRRSRFCAKHH